MLIVDPYLNSEIYLSFAPHCKAAFGLDCLTTKRTEYHQGLLACASKWGSSQIHVSIKYAEKSALHDRLIIIDGREVWLISQSIKDIAKNSPAYVSRADAELSRIKADHYEELWRNSAPLA